MPVSFPTSEGQPELPNTWNDPEVEELLVGGVDLHVHPFPSPFPRRMGILEAARDAARAKYRAIAVKSHHHSMVPDVLALNEAGLGEIPVKVFGGVALNGHVGCLNPYAVDLAANLGGRIVWFPTLAAFAHAEHVREEESHGRAGFVQATITLRPDVPVSILDEAGKVKPEVTDILEIIAAHDIILACGHLAAQEVDALIDEAVRVKVQRILVNHPQFVVHASPELSATWARKGAYIEHICSMYNDTLGTRAQRYPFEDLQAYIAAVGVDHTVMSSDTGQLHNIRPTDAIRIGARQLLDAGYEGKQVAKMIGDNAAQLLLKDGEF